MTEREDTTDAVRRAFWYPIGRFLGGWLTLWLGSYAAAWTVQLVANSRDLANHLSDYVAGPPLVYGMMISGCLTLGALTISIVIFKMFRHADAPLVWRGIPAWLLAWGLAVGAIWLFHLSLKFMLRIGPGAS